MWRKIQIQTWLVLLSSRLQLTVSNCVTSQKLLRVLKKYHVEQHFDKHFSFFQMTEFVDSSMKEIIVCNVDPLMLEPFDDSNPWMVDNVATFLKYCCPECDFKENNLQLFSDHAVQNHENAYALFDDVSPDICAESEEIDPKSYIDDDFKNIDIKTETKDLVLEGDHAMDDDKIFVDGVPPKKNEKESLPQNHLPITNTGSVMANYVFQLALTGRNMQVRFF